MDDRLNRVTIRRRKRSLLCALIVCVNGACLTRQADADQAWVPSTLPHADRTANRTPATEQNHSSQFVCEPEEVQSLPWSNVAQASILPPLSPPVPATIPVAPRTTLAIPSPESQTSASPFTTIQAHRTPTITVPAIPAVPAMEDVSGKPHVPALLTAARKRKAKGPVVDLASLEVIEDESEIGVGLGNQVNSQSAMVLPGISIQALRQSAARSLADANDRLRHRASFSAAASATHALELIAQSIDLSRGNGTASKQLDEALMAIREADDFVGRYGLVDSAAIARMVQSHETKTLKGFNTSHLTGIIAADVYLDSSRQQLSTLATADPLAAHAIGLLAKSYRQRTAESPLALATSVHLMRAAVFAAPRDRGLSLELASVLQEANMLDEAREQQAYASTLPAPTGPDSPFDASAVIAVVSGTKSGTGQGDTEQAVRIEQISAEAFAMVSKAEAGPTGALNATVESDARTGGKATNQNAPESMESQDPNKKEGNVVTRAFKTMTRKWR